MVTGNILEVVWQSQYLSQSVLNVQFVELLTVEADATETDVAKWAFQLFTTKILQFLSDQYMLNGVVCKNVTDGLGIGATSEPFEPGLVSGGGLPPFVTWSFQQTRSSLITRHGHKLLAGVPEASQNNGITVFDSGNLADFADVFVAEWDNGGGEEVDHGFTAVPRIIGRTLNADTPPVYELDLAKVNPITGLLFRGISSANSRKFGRGI